MNKTGIPEDYLPPRQFMPRNVRLLAELDYPERLNLTETLLDVNLPEREGCTAIRFEDERITYGELHSRVNRFANALRELGVGKYDRVILRSPNVAEYFVWNFACLRIGAIPVLVSHLNRADELAFKINDSEAVAMCVHSESYPDVQKVMPECPMLKHVIVYGDRIPGSLSYDELVRGQSDVACSEEMHRTDFGRLIYSSGTTGKPKGILLSLEGILSVIDTAGRYILKITADDMLGGHPSFSFAFGSSFLYLPWRFGAGVSVISRFAPQRQLELVEQHGITILLAVPTAFRMMLDAEQGRALGFPRLRLCQSAGEPLPAKTFLDWRARFGQSIINSLGSGELNYWLSTFEDMPDDKIGSSGINVPGYENVVVDEQFNSVPAGTLGELIVRGPVGQLYWRRPEAQKKGICPPDSAYPGWSRPGLYCLKDENGYFWLKSRIDDMIVTAGYKVPGGEVEAALNAHPAVLESAVIGLPDEERGNIIKAYVVPREGVRADPELAQQLQDFVKQALEPYKYPRQIEFATADMLPRTVTGKIQRNALRDRDLARRAASGPGTVYPLTEEVRRSTETALASGLHCAESVAAALAKSHGADADMVSRMATGFCGGMALTRGPCGALTGAVMGLGLALGRKGPGESTQTCYEATQNLVRAFEGEFGSRDCHQLLGCDLGTPEGQVKFREERLHERCARYACRAAEIATMLISQRVVS